MSFLRQNSSLRNALNSSRDLFQFQAQQTPFAKNRCAINRYAVFVIIIVTQWSKWRAGWIKKYVRTIQNNPSTASKMITQLWPNPIGMHYEQQSRTREHHLQKIMPSNYPPVTLIDASSGVLCWNNMHATLTTLYFSSHPRHPAKGGYIIISCIGRYQQIVLGWRRCRHS